MMRQQAEKNRNELSLLYNHMRDILMEREEALKTYISEILRREEEACGVKINQINEVIESV